MWYYVDGHFPIAGMEKFRIDEGFAMLARDGDFTLIRAFADLIDLEFECRNRLRYPTSESYLETGDIFLVKMPGMFFSYPWGLGFKYSWKDVPWYRLITADEVRGAQRFPPLEDLPPELLGRKRVGNPQTPAVMLD